MSTTIADLRVPVRAVLNDFDTVVRKYQDAAIDAVVAMIVNTGQLPGFATASGNTLITPDVTGRNYGLLIYKAARAFVAPAPDGYSYRTRALSESFGGQKNFLHHLEQALHDIDQAGGGMFGTQLDFQSWFLSISGGFNPWAAMTDMNVNAPVATVTVGSAGLQVSST